VHDFNSALSITQSRRSDQTWGLKSLNLLLSCLLKPADCKFYGLGGTEAALGGGAGAAAGAAAGFGFGRTSSACITLESASLAQLNDSPT